MYDVNFQILTSPPAFVDPKLPDSYAPFNIVPINGELFVTFAVQEKHDDVAGQSHGIVDAFDLGWYIAPTIRPARPTQLALGRGASANWFR